MWVKELLLPLLFNVYLEILALVLEIKNVNIGKEKGFFVCLFVCFLFVFWFFLSFRALTMVYGGSQARALIGAVAAGLHQSHSNTGSEPHL